MLIVRGKGCLNAVRNPAMEKTAVNVCRIRALSTVFPFLTPHGVVFAVALASTSFGRERSCCAPRLVGAGSRSTGGLRFIPIREAPP